MGKWNYRRTWRPKNYYRDQRIPTPPTYYDTEYKLREAWKNDNIPWEERFCMSVGIPWKNVVNTKKYMHCYDNVVKWDDSAGESAFTEAKQRFFENINGIPTDDPQPDPDMYNNEIDWNSTIDLELMKDLDLAYYNPDEAEKAEYVYAPKKNGYGYGPGCILGLDSKNVSNSFNPWKSDKKTNLNNNKDGWNRADNSHISDPWERGIAQDDRETKENAWGGAGSSLWHQETTWEDGANNSWHYRQFAVQEVDHVSKNTWGSAYKETGWGSNRNNSAARGTQPDRPMNRQRGGYTYRDTSFGRGQTYNWESKAGFRKREGSQQYSSSYKSARVQSDDYREGNQYRR